MNKLTESYLRKLFDKRSFDLIKEASLEKSVDEYEKRMYGEDVFNTYKAKNNPVLLRVIPGGKSNG